MVLVWKSHHSWWKRLITNLDPEIEMLGSGLTNRQVVSLAPTKTSSKPRRPETRFLRTPEPHGRIQTTREFGVCHVSFFETLFNGSKSSDGSAKEQADELVSELLQIMKKNKRGNKPYIGENERIAEIANDLQSLNITRNPAKSSNLFGDYEVGYANRQITPPFGFNLRISFLENYEVVQAFDVLNLGLFTKPWKRFANLSPNGPKTYTLAFTRAEQDKGPIGGIEVVEFDGNLTRTFDIVHLDDRVLITFGKPTKTEENDSALTILVRKGTTEAPKVQKSVQAEISPGKGVSGQGRKVTGATMAEKKYKKQFEQRKRKAEAENSAKQVKAEAARLQKQKAESAAKQAREAARLEKEKAAAEREAALKLKAEIKGSVDGFGLRLKEAQTNKKEAASALKNFERENSDVLKEAEILQKRLNGFDDEIAGLTEEIAEMVEEEKKSASELRDCRQQLSDLERQLAAL